MRVENSSMPEDTYWNSLFCVNEMVDWLTKSAGSLIIEVEDGYGTLNSHLWENHQNGTCLRTIKMKGKLLLVFFDI